MNSPMPAVLVNDAEAWALRINARWRQSVENIIEAGQLLIDAKAQLVHGEFEAMIESRLDFSASAAQRLMIIARDNRLKNPAHVQLLPRSWGTLYELTKLTDEEFARGVEEHIIGPDMERKDVALIRPTPKREVHHSDDGELAPAQMQERNDSESIRDDEISGDTMQESRPAPAATAPSDDPFPMPSGGLAIAHRRVEEKESLDFFPTPPWATRALFDRVLAHIGRNGHCQYQTAWEPCCGEGHMSETMKEYFRVVNASDKGIYPAYANEYDVADFLDARTVGSDKVDWIITNPPFNDSVDVVLKALKLAGTGVAMFVRLAWLESVGRYEKIFRDNPPTTIAIFSERVPLHKGRWEEDGTTMTAYIWLVWIKGAEPRAPFWIPPGCREELTRLGDRKKFGKYDSNEEAA